MSTESTTEAEWAAVSGMDLRGPSRRNVLAGVGLGALGLALTSCSPAPARSGSSGEPRRGGTLQISRADSFDGWEPDKAAAYSSYQLLGAVLEPLLRVSPDGSKVVPGIGESWEYSAAKPSWTIKIRKSAKFSDGTPVTSADVAFSLGIWKAGPNFGSSYAALKTAHTPDAQTVVFELTRPDHVLPTQLAAQPSAVYPKDFGGRSAKDFYAKPVGAGAFTVASWSTTGATTLERSKHYYLPGRPYVDRIISRVASATSSAAQFASSQTDIVEFAQFEVAPQFGDSLVTLPTSQVEHISLNTTRKPLDDRYLRLAIAYALDYDAILKGAYRGYGTSPRGILPPTGPDFAPPTVTPYKKNLTKARDMLKASPNSGALSLEAIYDSGTRQHELLAQIVQSNLKELGVTLTLTGLETGAFLDRIFSLDADMAIWSYGAITASMSDSLGWIIGTSGLFTGADTKTMEKARDTYEAASTVTDRKKIITDIQNAWMKDAAAIPVCGSKALFGVADKVQGFKSPPWGVYYWDQIWLGV